jgi:hypothetical protein
VSWELLSALTIAGGALLIAALERLRPYDRGYVVLRRGFFTDLVGYALAQS